MATIDARYIGVSTQHTHKRFSGATTAATLVAAQGTGISIVPVLFRWVATVAGSVFLTATSGGGSIFRSQFLANSQEQGVPWWDTGLPPNTPITLEVPSDCGVGEFDIWWVVVRGGAGAGATTQ